MKLFMLKLLINSDKQGTTKLKVLP